MCVFICDICIERTIQCNASSYQKNRSFYDVFCRFVQSKLLVAHMCLRKISVKILVRNPVEKSVLLDYGSEQDDVFTELEVSANEIYGMDTVGS